MTGRGICLLRLPPECVRLSPFSWSEKMAGDDKKYLFPIFAAAAKRAKKEEEKDEGATQQTQPTTTATTTGDFSKKRESSAGNKSSTPASAPRTQVREASISCPLACHIQISNIEAEAEPERRARGDCFFPHIVQLDDEKKKNSTSKPNNRARPLSSAPSASDRCRAP